MKKVRDSNMELLRLLAMFLVLVYHADFLSLGVPSANVEMSASQWVDSSLRFFVQSLCVVCVNVFVMLSGWFGIRFSLDRMLSLIFQVTFFTVIGISVNILFWNHHLDFDDLKNIFMMNDNLWFPKSYLLLYIFSPVLNAFCVKATARQFRLVLVAMIVFQMLYGWMTRGVDWYMGGYSTIFFIELYLLAHYVRHYVDYSRYSALSLLGLFFVGASFMSSVWIFLTLKGFDVTRFFNVYTQPFAVFGSLALLMLFSKCNFRSKAINYVAASCFSVYLFHCAPGMLQHFTDIVSRLHENYGLPLFPILTLSLIMAVYAVSVLLDQVRILFWRMIQRWSLFVKFVDKWQIYL